MELPILHILAACFDIETTGRFTREMRLDIPLEIFHELLDESLAIWMISDSFLDASLSSPR